MTGLLSAAVALIHAGGDNYSDQHAPLGGGVRLACGVVVGVQPLARARSKLWLSLHPDWARTTKNNRIKAASRDQMARAGMAHGASTTAKLPDLLR
jgi:hypothetical protein